MLAERSQAADPEAEQADAAEAASTELQGAEAAEKHDVQGGGQQQKAADQQGSEQETAKLAISSALEGEVAAASGAASTLHKFAQASGSAHLALKRYIASFREDAEDGPQLGTQPPCRSYRSLQVFSELNEADEAKIKQARTKEELAAIASASKPFKSAYQDLLTMAKAAANRAKHAIASERGAMEKKKRSAMDGDAAAEASAAKRRKSTRDAAAPAKLMAMKHSLGEPLPTASVTQELTLSADISFGTPAILRFTPEVVTTEGVLRKEITAMRNKFNTSAERADPGRGHRPLGSDAQQEALRLLAGVIPKTELVPHDKLQTSPALAADLKPVVFAIAKGRETFGMETAQLPTLRLAFDGTREVFCAPAMELMEHIASLSESKALPTAKAVTTFLRGCTVDQMKSFILTNPTTNKFFHGTLGPQDALFLPAGWAFGEKVLSGSDVYGIRVQIIFKTNMPALDKFNSIFLSQQKPSPVLQRVLDFLALQAH